MIGFIERVKNGVVYGWALDPANPGEPVTVNVAVNGQAVATALAACKRADVALSFGSPGYHGFYVDLKACDCPRGKAVIEAWTSDGSPLSSLDAPYNTPLSITIPGPSHDERPAVLFMHIPKTAGTAFHEAIRDSYHSGEALYLYPHGTFHPADISILRFPLDHRSRLRFIVGHFVFGIHRALPQRYEYISLVRKPLDRLVSQYFHWVRHAPEKLSNGCKVIGFSEALANPPDAAMDNIMVRYFAGMEAVCAPVGSVDRAMFKLALKNIREQFAYIGLQESSWSAYEMLARRYGWDPSRRLLWANLGGYRLDPEEYERGRSIAAVSEQWDIRLYQKIQTMFGHPSATPTPGRDTQRQRPDRDSRTV